MRFICVRWLIFIYIIFIQDGFERTLKMKKTKCENHHSFEWKNCLPVEWINMSFWHNGWTLAPFPFSNTMCKQCEYFYFIDVTTKNRQTTLEVHLISCKKNFLQNLLNAFGFNNWKKYSPFDFIWIYYLFHSTAPTIAHDSRKKWEWEELLFFDFLCFDSSCYCIIVTRRSEEEEKNAARLQHFKCKQPLKE